MFRIVSSFRLPNVSRTRDGVRMGTEGKSHCPPMVRVKHPSLVSTVVVLLLSLLSCTTSFSSSLTTVQQGYRDRVTKVRTGQWWDSRRGSRLQFQFQDLFWNRSRDSPPFLPATPSLEKEGTWRRRGPLSSPSGKPVAGKKRHGDIE